MEREEAGGEWGSSGREERGEEGERGREERE